MSNIENLHARIQIVNPDGTPTPPFMEAIRASRKPILDIIPTAADNAAGFFTFRPQHQGHLYIDKGTVTAILLTRGSKVVDLNSSMEMVPLNPYDELQVVYSAVPEMHWVPW
jgi:hypothetical protein